MQVKKFKKILADNDKYTVGVARLTNGYDKIAVIEKFRHEDCNTTVFTPYDQDETFVKIKVDGNINTMGMQEVNNWFQSIYFDHTPLFS